MTALAINTDVGEGFGVWGPADEGDLLDQVTAANVACGFHAGDPDILRRTCEASAARGVAIGAQVSYRDLAGFGRRFIDVPKKTLVNELLYQIGALEVFARLAGSRVSYLKAHGALYNAAAHHVGHAEAIVEAVTLYDRGLPLLCQPRTVVWERAVEAALPAAGRGVRRPGLHGRGAARAPVGAGRPGHRSRRGGAARAADGADGHGRLGQWPDRTDRPGRR